MNLSRVTFSTCFPCCVYLWFIGRCIEIELDMSPNDKKCAFQLFVLNVKQFVGKLYISHQCCLRHLLLLMETWPFCIIKRKIGNAGELVQSHCRQPGNIVQLALLRGAPLNGVGKLGGGALEQFDNEAKWRIFVAMNRLRTEICVEYNG